MNYRKIYTEQYGTIPKDEFGRSYEIHHIDGNRKNNDITNLKAVTIQEHYDIHYSQGDWAACYMIAKKMKISPKIISELMRKENKRRVDAGDHPFLGGEIQRRTQKRISKENKHHTQIDSRNGKHRWMSENNPTHKMIEDGTHPFQNTDIQRKNVQALNKKMLENGTHPFLNKLTCNNIGCGRKIQIANFNRHKMVCNKKVVV